MRKGFYHDNNRSIIAHRKYERSDIIGDTMSLFPIHKQRNSQKNINLRSMLNFIKPY
jgi:hypothetical protein